MIGGLAATVTIGAGSWYVVSAQGDGEVHAVCDLDTSTDAKLAAAAYGIAIVEPLTAGEYRAGDGGSATLVSHVKVVEAVKGSYPASLRLTQALEDGARPGAYKVRDGARNVPLEPGRQYVSVILAGDTMANPGTEAWSSYTQPVKRGRDGEVSYWKQATAASPDGAQRSPCVDTYVSQ
ncbi:hypothetical protein ACWGHM_34655 [Streptomyces sp. NPDC054904]|uniref:hypothetical protein n=1 Tax=Streptomyces sp. NPDC090054 TaxID=3365933 RepID=UPI0038186834